MARISYKNDRKEVGEFKVKSVEPEAQVVTDSFIYEIKDDIEPKISFEVFFQILLNRKKKIQQHHAEPIRRFMQQFGDLNSQTQAWFEDKFNKY